MSVNDFETQPQSACSLLDRTVQGIYAGLELWRFDRNRCQDPGQNSLRRSSGGQKERVCTAQYRSDTGYSCSKSHWIRDKAVVWDWGHFWVIPTRECHISQANQRPAGCRRCKEEEIAKRLSQLQRGTDDSGCYPSALVLHTHTSPQPRRLTSWSRRFLTFRKWKSESR